MTSNVSEQETEIQVEAVSSVQEYVNPAFEFSEDAGSTAKLADIVDWMMKRPSVTDIHPYGRGNLYASIFEHKTLGAHTDSGKLISWVVVTVLLVGIAGGIVMLAMSWEANHTAESHLGFNRTSFT